MLRLSQPPLSTLLLSSYYPLEETKNDDRQSNLSHHSSTITVEKVKSLLSKLPISAPEFNNISAALSSKINQLISARSNKATSQNAPFYLTISSNGKELECIFSNREVIGQGSVKKVLKGFSITTKFPPENGLKQNCQATTSSTVVLFEPNDREAIQYIERGIVLQEKLQKLIPQAMFPEAIRHVEIDTKSLYFQKKYATNLQEFIENGFRYGEKPLKIQEILDIFIQAASFLKECHKLKFVHCNIKPTNILVDINKDSQNSNLAAFVTDYDLMQIAGPGSVPHSNYADHLAKQNFPTPFTDVYGLAICLEETLQKIGVDRQSKSVTKAIKELSSLIQKIFQIEFKLKQAFSIEQEEHWLSFKQNSVISQKQKSQILKSNTNKNTALQFMDQMSKLSSEDQWAHPLYVALEEPTQLENLETIKHSIYKEVDLIGIDKESELYSKMQNQLKDIHQGNKRLIALKSLLQRILNSEKESQQIKIDAKKIIEQIEIIENAMAFAINLRDRYRESVNQIMKMAMPMEDFLLKLIAIKKTLTS